MALKPVRVSQLNSYIKRLLQTDPILGNVSVIGEISNLKFHSSGHVYFSLKDESSKVNCFLPADTFAGLTCRLEEGIEVTASGYIYLYERGGTYSINIRTIEISGQGELAAKFLKLKQKLEAEGIFDKAHKKPIPSFPYKVAVVTSETGAAVRDIIKTIKRKNNFTDIIVYPVLVQGHGAAGEISSAIDDLNRNYHDIDVIITGRGGGSIEELWAFNEEEVARSIYNSRIPVISAVGHETDFTIADFAADLRAETPTAAAERAVPDTGALRDNLNNMHNEITEALRLQMDKKKQRLEMLNPDMFSRDIRSRAVMDRIKLDNLFQSMGDRLSSYVSNYRNRIAVMKEILDTCNPENVLQKGYSVLTDSNGNIVKSTAQLTAKQAVTIRMAQGRAEAVIKSIMEDS
ncbi:MAG: exodeoxyribonuclease VII large subunit [Bacillota bacterium]|nr:exodeoxyribonuclease VII large subunit [Bacillota bacterium]